MKKLFFSVMLFAICQAVCGQQTEPAKNMTKQDYLQKGRNQQTIGWVMLGGGALLTAGGLIWFYNEFDVLYEDNDSGEGGLILAGVGAAAMAGSIPLFVSSARNKQKARNMNAGIILEKQGRFSSKGVSYQLYPALSFRMSLR